MKKIIHQKVPYNMSINVAFLWHDNLAKLLNNDDYIVVTTPTELECINDNDTIITIDNKCYTYAQIKAIVNQITDSEDR